jgi:hypothetical protein
VLDYVADTRSRELFTLTVLVIALGIAVGSSLIFSVSMAPGAFLPGMVVGRSDYSLRAASEALPMRDAFAVLFFVSVGMLLDPAALVTAPWLVPGALGIVLVGKPLVALLLAWAMRYPFRASLTVGIALAQIGEFSFTRGRRRSRLLRGGRGGPRVRGRPARAPGRNAGADGPRTGAGARGPDGLNHRDRVESRETWSPEEAVCPGCSCRSVCCS